MTHSKQYEIYSDAHNVTLHFMDTNEPFLAKIQTLYVFECIGTNHLETKQTSPMSRIRCVSANSAYAGSVSRSCDLLPKNVLAESPSRDENQSSTSPFPDDQRRTIGAVKQTQAWSHGPAHLYCL